MASQDPQLRAKLRRLPAVPLLHMIRNTMVLEKPSESTNDKAEQVCRVQCSIYVSVSMLFVDLYMLTICMHIMILICPVTWLCMYV